MDKILLVQHCQSQHHLDRARQFPDCDNGLTELGHAQAEAVGQRIASGCTNDDVRLYSSDMARARETAGIIGSALGQLPITKADLREWSDPLTLERQIRPSWTGPCPNDDLFDWRPYPEHETWREFLHRISGVMSRLAKELPQGTLPVLVVHGGTLSNVVVWWLGLPLDDLPERTCFAATPGSISVVARNAYGNPVVERLNDRSHLAAMN